MIIAPIGPAQYDEADVEGHLLIAAAASGKSLLQSLTRNDIHYQTLLSEYAQEESIYNLTDARLLLVWGKNFPDHEKEAVAFASSDPAISYREFNRWSATLWSTQQETYGKYPSWLAETGKLNKKIWDRTWKKVKDVLGAKALTSIKTKDYMLVLALPKKGILPGMKAFSINGAETHWYLDTGTAKAEVRFLRRTEDGKEEPITTLYPGDPFFVELRTNRAINNATLSLSYTINDKRLQAGNIALEATRYGTDGKTYRTTAIVLQESETDGTQYYMGTSGYTELVCKTGSVFKVMVTDASLFSNETPFAAAPLLSPAETLWQQSLRQTVLLTDTPDLPESEWETSLSKMVKLLVNESSTDTSNGETGGNCLVTMGDYTGMLLLKKYFIRHLKTYYNTLEKHKNDEWFQYGFWELMAPGMKHLDFLPGTLNVTRKAVPLRDAFSKEAILSHYTSPKAAGQWIRNAKKEGFAEYVNTIKTALDHAERLDDKDIEKLLSYTYSGFNVMAALVKADIVAKQCLENTDNTCETTFCRWKPNVTGRTYITSAVAAAARCAVRKASPPAETDALALAAASLAAIPSAAYSTYEKFTAIVHEAALGSGELNSNAIKPNTKGNTETVKKTQQLLEALDEMLIRNTMYSYFGNGFGISETVSDLLGSPGKASLREAYSKLPSLVDSIDRHGVLPAYKALSDHDKVHFLLLLGEGDKLREFPMEKLSTTQRKLLLTTAQFTDALYAVARTKDTIGETTDAVRVLREALPENLRDSIVIIKDDALPGNIIHPEYELDAFGFLTHVNVRAGKTATAQNIAANAPVLTKMKAYEPVAHAIGNLYRSIDYWYNRHFGKAASFGSPARKIMQELHLLQYRITHRLDRLTAKETVTQEQIVAELQDLYSQLARHQQAFSTFMAYPGLARGGITSRGDVVTAETISETIKAAVENALASNDAFLKAWAQRIQNVQDFLSRTPERNSLYDAVIADAIKKKDPETATRFLYRLSYFSELTPEQVTGIKAFVATTGDIAVLNLILQQRYAQSRKAMGYNAATVQRILGLLYEGKDHPEMLHGIAFYLNAMGRNTVISLDKLRSFIETSDVENYNALFTTVATFKDSKNFKKILPAHSSGSQNSITGAMGQLAAARKFADTYGKEAITFQQHFYEKNAVSFRDIGVLVRSDDGKIAKLVTCKASARLAGFFTAEAKRQFAKDLLLAYRNGLKPSEGLVWMIRKTALKSGKEALQLKRMTNQFLTVFSDESFKDFRCKIDQKTLNSFKNDIQDHYKAIFQFF